MKRLKFDKEGDVRETASQMVSGEVSSVRAEETETAAPPPDKDRESRTRQHCTEEEEEEEEEEDLEEEEEIPDPICIAHVLIGAWSNSQWLNS